MRLPKPAAEVVEALAEQGMLAGVPVSRLLPGAGLDDLLLVAATEINTDDDRAAFVRRARRRCCDAEPSRTSHPAPDAAGIERHATFTGNRALAADEPLIFEIGRRDDRRRPRRAGAVHAAASASSRARTPIGLPGLSEPEAMRHYVRLSRRRTTPSTPGSIRSARAR